MERNCNKYEKFDWFSGAWKGLINENNFKNYVAFSNNAYESINYLINNYIQSNIK